MKRGDLRSLARTIETTVKAGHVQGVPFGHHVTASIKSTKYYRPRELKSIAKNYASGGTTLPDLETQICFTKRTTVAAIRENVAGEGNDHVAALNFASYRKPGGGWRSGAVAQEESLARASALTQTLETKDCKEFYGTEKVKTRGFADQELLRNGIIFSEKVPFIATEEGELCAPYFCSVITAAAVNSNAREVKSALSKEQIEQIMDIRVENVLAIALHREVSVLILGAWGTGVFGNSIETIAGLFKKHIGSTYKSCFLRIEFAIPDEPTFETFQEAYQRSG